MSLGIYIHVPFCRRKCDYCDFYSVCDTTAVNMDAYTRAVCTHIAEAAVSVESRQEVVDTVYFGGGTPSVLGAERLKTLLGAVQRWWTVDKNAEITLEANPESCDLKLLKKLRRAGFNRLSLGVQSSDDAELAALGRLHDFRDAQEAVAAARKAGVDNISLDLMYGIEGQTPESFGRSVDDIVALAPSHISAYGLTVEEGTPLSRRNPQNLADDDGQADMYRMACDMLRAAGYEHYEVSNWAKPGSRSRHNSRYWRLEPYIGFGPAAHSDCGGKRYSTAPDLQGYIKAVEGGDELLDDCYAVTESGRMFEYFMLGLRLSDGIELEVLRRRFRRDPDSASGVLDNLQQRGFVEVGDGRVRLTEDGFLLSNTLILEIMDAFKPLENPFTAKGYGRLRVD